ncbi:MAG: carboxylating nicotinate-nucleotide diphosphorylase [Candidatus Peregrinibacteria bacterium]
MSLLKIPAKFHLKASSYLKAVKQYVWEAYLSDLADGDRTTEYFVSKPKQVIRAEVIANDRGIFAGLMEAKWLLGKVDVKILRHKSERVVFKPGEVLLTLRGRADRILGVERTLLNLLQRMSGVATAAHRLASKLPRRIKLLATRKTFWGLLDKRAATVGGALSHRFNLSDAVMVKDNHLLLEPYFEKPWKRVMKKAKKVRFVEMELDNFDDIKTFVTAYHKCQGCFSPAGQVVVLLDNLTPTQVRHAIKLLKPTHAMIEVSGGINEHNIRRYALPGVHAISSGSITNKAPALDLFLRIAQ